MKGIDRIGGFRRWAQLRIYFAMLAVSFVAAALAAAAYVDVQTGRDARRGAKADAHHAAAVASKQLGDDLALVRATAAGLAANPQIAGVLAHPAGCTLSFSAGGAGGHLDLLRDDGTVACSSLPSGKRHGGYAGDSWLRRASAGTLLQAPVRDAATGVYAAITAVPIRGGVVAAFVDLDTTGPELASLYGGGHPIEFLVTSGDGRTVVARSVHAKRWIRASLADSPFLRFEGNGQHPDVEGRSRIYAETTVPGAGWRFYAGEDSSAALADQHHLERRQLEIILAGLALALLATFFIYRPVALPIPTLGRAGRSAASSSPPDPVPVTGPTEIAALGKDVNSLIDAVGNELRQRQQTEEELRQLAAIVESSHDAIVGRTLDGVVTSWNAAAETLFGYTAAEMIGRPVALLVPEGQEEVAAISDAIERDTRVQFEAVRVRKDGVPIDVSTTVSPIRDASGAIVGASTISHDIGDRKRLEQELRVSEE